MKTNKEIFALTNVINGSRNCRGVGKNLHEEFTKRPRGIYCLYCRIPGAIYVQYV